MKHPVVTLYYEFDLLLFIVSKWFCFSNPGSAFGLSPQVCAVLASLLQSLLCTFVLFCLFKAPIPTTELRGEAKGEQ